MEALAPGVLKPCGCAGMKAPAGVLKPVGCASMEALAGQKINKNKMTPGKRKKKMQFVLQEPPKNGGEEKKEKKICVHMFCRNHPRTGVKKKEKSVVKKEWSLFRQKR